MVGYFKYVLSVVASSLVTVGPAHALLLSTGDEVIFNFDFTGASPPPPYGEVLVIGDVTTASLSVDLFFFGGLDAA